MPMIDLCGRVIKRFDSVNSRVEHLLEADNNSCGRRLPVAHRCAHLFQLRSRSVTAGDLHIT